MRAFFLFCNICGKCYWMRIQPKSIVWNQKKMKGIISWWQNKNSHAYHNWLSFQPYIKPFVFVCLFVFVVVFVDDVIFSFGKSTEMITKTEWCFFHPFFFSFKKCNSVIYFYEYEWVSEWGFFYTWYKSINNTSIQQLIDLPSFCFCLPSLQEHQFWTEDEKPSTPQPLTTLDQTTSKAHKYIYDWNEWCLLEKVADPYFLHSNTSNAFFFKTSIEYWYCIWEKQWSNLLRSSVRILLKI